MKKFVLIIAPCFLAISFWLFIGSSTPKTTENLLQQAAGERVFWNSKGLPHRRYEALTSRNYNHRAQVYAVRKLGELGSDANDAVDALLKLMKEQDDLNTGDGVLTLRSDIARTLGLIGDPTSIDVTIKWFRNKALDPKTDAFCKADDIRWHGNSDYYIGNSTCGPAGIINGLKWYDTKYHGRIKAALVEMLAELKGSNKSSTWAKRAVENGLQFFSMSDAQRIEEFQLLVKPSYDFQCSEENGIARNE